MSSAREAKALMLAVGAALAMTATLSLPAGSPWRVAGFLPLQRLVWLRSSLRSGIRTLILILWHIR